MVQTPNGPLIPPSGEFQTLQVSNLLVENEIQSVNTNSLTLNNSSGVGATIVASESTPADYNLTLPVDDGTSGQVLSTDGLGVLSWTTVGGGGTPSAPPNSIQFNDGGSFGGSSGLTFDGTNTVTFAANGTITAPTNPGTGAPGAGNLSILAGSAGPGFLDLPGNLLLSGGVSSLAIAGNATLKGGDSTVASGGHVIINSGQGKLADSFSSGNITIEAMGGTAATGGSVIVKSGDSTLYAGGDVTLEAGPGVGPSYGHGRIIIKQTANPSGTEFEYRWPVDDPVAGQALMVVATYVGGPVVQLEWA